MPVNISCIPVRAKRRTAPSLKRWLMILVMLITIGSLTTAYFWPASVLTHTATFWLCSLGIPVMGGGAIFALRWLVYLSGEWFADGWDSAREQDLAQNIRAGQRSLALLGYTVHLPHVISADSISRQLLIPDIISLPLQLDETGELFMHSARFINATLPVQDRVKEQVRTLLTDSSLQSALQRLPGKTSLAVLFQFCPEIPVSPEEYPALQQFVKEVIGFPFNMTFVRGEGLQVVDAWLDSPEMMQYMLVIALNLSEKTTDGVGEAAVALLMGVTEKSEVARNVVAEIHRPEQVKTEKETGNALLQALHWGKTTPEAIKNIWLTGTGTSNEAMALLSNSGIRFPAVGQPCDIDLKTGLTMNVSPWLAMTVAADQAGRSESPQVVMCIPFDSIQPWFMVVCPLE